MSKCERCKGLSGSDEVGGFQIAGFHHVWMCLPCSREWDRAVLKGAWQRLELAKRRLEIHVTGNDPVGALDKCVEDVGSARQLMISWFALFLLSDPDGEDGLEAAVDTVEQAEAES